MNTDLGHLEKGSLSAVQAISHLAKKSRYALDMESFQSLDKSRIIAEICYILAVLLRSLSSVLEKPPTGKTSIPGPNFL